MSAQPAEDLVEGDEGGMEVRADMEEVKTRLLTQSWSDNEDRMTDPPGGLTKAVLRFRDDLAALLSLAVGEQLAIRHIRSHRMLTAYYGFGDAFSGGFGSTVQQLNGLFGWYGLWGRDMDDQNDQNSNYREMCNLVEAVEIEAKEEYLKGGELWMFTNNMTAESCFLGVTLPQSYYMSWSCM
jgi:hypothetical protein